MVSRLVSVVSRSFVLSSTFRHCVLCFTYAIPVFLQSILCHNYADVPDVFSWMYVGPLVARRQTDLAPAINLQVSWIRLLRQSGSKSWGHENPVAEIFVSSRKNFRFSGKFSMTTSFSRQLKKLSFTKYSPFPPTFWGNFSLFIIKKTLSNVLFVKKTL